MKKFTMLVSLFCVCAFLAFGAGSKETPQQVVKEAGPITLTILTTATTQNPEGPLAQEFFDEFMRLNPEIKLEVTGVPMNQALTKITTLAAAGSLPDVFVNTENIIGQLYDMGICEDLTPYMTKAELENITESVRIGSTMENKLVLYPWYSGPNALIFRKDWLEEKGISAPKTLEEMRLAAKALTADTNKDSLVDRWGFGMIGTNDDSGQTRFVMILRGFGAKELYFQDGTWKTDIGSPASVEAFKYFTNLKNVDNVVPAGALENSFNENVNLLAAEQIGMLIAGSNSVGKIFSANPGLKGKIGSVIVPSGVTSYTPSSILGWSVNPSSKHKEAAVKFVKFVSSKKNAIKWVEVTGRIPCTNDAISDSEYLNTPLFEGFVAGFKAMEQAPNAPYYAEVKNVLGRTYQKLILNPALDATKEVQAAGREIQKIIDNNK
ncbi:sugar ABC transporter substrate-binding protein [Sphaerochaeta sp. PS]|uniref:ABC transporter substrate-binding protein n=1 Tax=Sphaerochaeta sp. PS TaxID=3076336 RepID=UPI0028A4ACD4|nr:sugar ABC transporter substrate-binding protein [Sphaerochaeta sp. PS]MDT4762719.1 sugar ABC transporter substrate-binding protein [Sphaerochaeta sp. PS]